jgi:hypothetical protein
MAEISGGWCALSRISERVLVAADVESDVCVLGCSANSNDIFGSTGLVSGRGVGTSKNIDVSRRMLTFE